MGHLPRGIKYALQSTTTKIASHHLRGAALRAGAERLERGICCQVFFFLSFVPKVYFLLLCCVSLWWLDWCCHGLVHSRRVLGIRLRGVSSKGTMYSNYCYKVIINQKSLNQCRTESSCPLLSYHWFEMCFQRREFPSIKRLYSLEPQEVGAKFCFTNRASHAATGVVAVLQ